MKYWSCRYLMPSKSNGLCLEPTINGKHCKAHADLPAQAVPVLSMVKDESITGDTFVVKAHWPFWPQ